MSEALAVSAHLGMCHCRCYEIRCSTGTVIGNYTAAGNDVVSTIPFNLTKGFTPKVDVDTVEDDYGRLWSGNDLEDQALLFTKCYNLSQVRCCAGRLLLLVMPDATCKCCSSACPLTAVV